MFHNLFLIVFMLLQTDNVHAASAAPTVFTSSTGALSDELQDIHNEILEMLEPVKTDDTKVSQLLEDIGIYYALQILQKNPTINIDDFTTEVTNKLPKLPNNQLYNKIYNNFIQVFLPALHKKQDQFSKEYKQKLEQRIKDLAHNIQTDKNYTKLPHFHTNPTFARPLAYGPHVFISPRLITPAETTASYSKPTINLDVTDIKNEISEIFMLVPFDNTVNMIEALEKISQYYALLILQQHHDITPTDLTKEVLKFIPKNAPDPKYQEAYIRFKQLAENVINKVRKMDPYRKIALEGQVKYLPQKAQKALQIDPSLHIRHIAQDQAIARPLAYGPALLQIPTDVTFIEQHKAHTTHTDPQHTRSLLSPEEIKLRSIQDEIAELISFCDTRRTYFNMVQEIGRYYAFVVLHENPNITQQDFLHKVQSLFLPAPDNKDYTDACNTFYQTELVRIFTDKRLPTYNIQQAEQLLKDLAFDQQRALKKQQKKQLLTLDMSIARPLAHGPALFAPQQIPQTQQSPTYKSNLEREILFIVMKQPSKNRNQTATEIMAYLALIEKQNDLTAIAEHKRNVLFEKQKELAKIDEQEKSGLIDQQTKLALIEEQNKLALIKEQEKQPLTTTQLVSQLIDSTFLPNHKKTFINLKPEIEKIVDSISLSIQNKSTEASSSIQNAANGIAKLVKSLSNAYQATYKQPMNELRYYGVNNATINNIPLYASDDEIKSFLQSTFNTSDITFKTISESPKTLSKKILVTFKNGQPLINSLKNGKTQYNQNQQLQIVGHISTTTTQKPWDYEILSQINYPKRDMLQTVNLIKQAQENAKKTTDTTEKEKYLEEIRMLKQQYVQQKNIVDTLQQHDYFLPIIIEQTFTTGSTINITPKTSQLSKIQQAVQVMHPTTASKQLPQRPVPFQTKQQAPVTPVSTLSTSPSIFPNTKFTNDLKQEIHFILDQNNNILKDDEHAEDDFMSDLLQYLILLTQQKQPHTNANDAFNTITQELYAHDQSGLSWLKTLKSEILTGVDALSTQKDAIQELQSRLKIIAHQAAPLYQQRHKKPLHSLLSYEYPLSDTPTRTLTREEARMLL